MTLTLYWVVVCTTAGGLFARWNDSMGWFNNTMLILFYSSTWPIWLALVLCERLSRDVETGKGGAR